MLLFFSFSKLSPGHSYPPWASPPFPGHPHPPRATQPFPPVHVPHNPSMTLFTVLNNPYSPLCGRLYPYLALPSPHPSIVHVSTSTLALLPYFHVYYGPVALLIRLLWRCCLTYTSTVAQLPYFHLYCGPVALCIFSIHFPYKKLLLYPQLLVCKKILLIYT